MKEAFSYYRIANKDIHKFLEVQKAKINEWAKANDFKIVNEYIDGNISGLSDPHERRAFNHMLSDLQKMAVYNVLVFDFARLSRDNITFFEIIASLKSKGIHVYSVQADCEATTILEELVNPFLIKASESSSEQMPDEILKILLNGSMNHEQYLNVLNYYIKNRAMQDWFGSAGVDGDGIYYHYIENYRTKEEKTFKVYLGR